MRRRKDILMDILQCIVGHNGFQILYRGICLEDKLIEMQRIIQFGVHNI